MSLVLMGMSHLRGSGVFTVPLTLQRQQMLSWGQGQLAAPLFFCGLCLLKISCELWELFSGQGGHATLRMFVESPSCLRVEASVPTAFPGAVGPGSRLCLKRAGGPVGENRSLSGLQVLVWREAVPSLIYLAVPLLGSLGGVILSDPSQIYSDKSVVSQKHHVPCLC